MCVILHTRFKITTQTYPQLPQQTFLLLLCISSITGSDYRIHVAACLESVKFADFHEVGDSGTKRINTGITSTVAATVPTSNIGSSRTKRMHNTVAQPSVSDHIHHLKRIKRFSSTTAAPGPSSKLMNTNIGDLPEAVLGEILGRLPCYKYIARCKCVSKRWCNVMSDPSFIGRFLYLRSDGKHPFMTRTLINYQGEEFLSRMSLSSKPLTHLFRRLMDFHYLKEEPIVVGTFNDLVLCCASMYNQRDYYICNPYTLKWTPLPPAPQVPKFTAVGFFCDLPFYEFKKNNLGGQDIQLNTEYRCRVVRLIDDHDVSIHSCEFKVQIFSSETGVWRELIVSSPSMFKLGEINLRMSFSHNGMLYWMSHSRNFLIGLDPFMMDNMNGIGISSTSSSTDDGDDSDRYECLFIEIDGSDGLSLRYLGVFNGCLQVGDYDYDTNTILVWELNEQVHKGAGKLCFEVRKRVYPLDWAMVPDDYYDLNVLAFDPNNDDRTEGTLYLYVNDDFDYDYGKCGDVLMYNICTRDFLKIVERKAKRMYDQFPVAVPWWPTPVPRLSEREANPVIPSSP